MKNNKGPKYINPTDKARKEARRRELKKNKKQRMIIRTALLKGKDPYQIIADLERLDRMEFDFNNQSPLSEKVLKDKRRKLKDTWDRVCRFYMKEDKNRYADLKRIEGDYEFKRKELIKQYDAIKSAREVKIDEIPLPTEQSGPTSILKTLDKSNLNKKPPGCPPGLPPSIDDLLKDIGNISSSDSEEETSKKIRFNDENENKDTKNVEKFLQEIEKLSCTNTLKSGEDVVTKSTEIKSSNKMLLNYSSIQPAPSILIQGTQKMVQPQFSSMVLPPTIMSSSVPVSLPGQLISIGLNGKIQPKQTSIIKKTQTTTIEAKPLLRNLSADSTKFMPLSLRVRRDEKQLMNQRKQPVSTREIYGIGYHTRNQTLKPLMTDNSRVKQIISNEKSDKNNNASNTKDDAYEQFMKEMKELI